MLNRTTFNPVAKWLLYRIPPKPSAFEGLSKNLRWHVVSFEIIPIYGASERSTDVAPDAALHRFWRKLLTI